MDGDKANAWADRIERFGQAAHVGTLLEPLT
jgi:hypothetical protein